jgi:predicted MPP superfamily phosphohydrolase
MSFVLRHTVEFFVLAFLIPAHFYFARRLSERIGRRTAFSIAWALVAMTLFGLALDAVNVQEYFPGWVHSVFRGLSLAWMMNCLGCAAVYAVLTPFRKQAPAEDPPHSPARRRLLQSAYAAPAAVLGYGAFIERDRFQLREVDIPTPGLPRSLHGLRIVQLTDIHMGAFLSERQLERVIGMANETKAHLAVMTGDLITKAGDPVDACLRQLARVKAEAGMLGCLGNHEIYASAEEYVEKQAARLGIDFLRNRSRKLVFNGETLNFAGIDYQTKSKGPYLRGSAALVAPGEVNILLSHNPDVFRLSPQKGFQLTIAGHTHGGQIAVEYLNPYLNVARFVTPYIAGYYHERGASLYVSRGIGTIGVPVRAGVPPEVTLLRLCAI